MTSPAADSLIKNKYFPALTGLRALAAYLVFFHHAFPANTSSVYWNQMVFAGQSGVTIFFVLSGFLISYKYNPVSGRIDYKNYLLKRFARIYPLYMLLTVLILVWQNDANSRHWFLNLTLLKGFFDAYKFTGIGPGWSLTVEACFYLLAPLLFSLFRLNGLVTLLILILSGGTLVVLAKAYYATIFFNSLSFMLGYTFFGRCFEFYCGYLVAQYYRQASVLSQNKLFTIMGLLLTLAGIGLVGFTSNIVWFTEESYAVKWSTAINNFCLPVAIGILLYGLITENTLFARILATKPAQVLGKSSYAFFLIHSGLIYEFFYFHLSTSRFLIFLALNGLAIILYYTLEKPLYTQITRSKTYSEPDL
ncbi:acyltransferase [Adhaeribacter swui]|uniref:Acyltransferase n=1 Tax=Adhaeribacter swui TaxID=2086471 RepID=A0A7G7G2P7_9BACT|nr:acyltransferase [Adhaeribacter swui]QNF31431.1 acyltransferase [Adhaeribacter swui]